MAVKLPKPPHAVGKLLAGDGGGATPDTPPATPDGKDPGHFTILGRKISWDALFIGIAGLIGGYLVIKGFGAGQTAAPAAAPQPATSSVTGALPSYGGAGWGSWNPVSGAAAPSSSTPTAAAGASGPASYWSSLYSSVLGRPADAGGLAYWSAEPNPQAATSQFLSSPEAVVQEDYATVLGRYAEPSGLAYWTGYEAQNGPTQTLAAIKASAAGGST